MAHCDPISDQAGQFVGQMNNCIVLDVRVVADFDSVDVSSDNGVVPDAGMIAEGDIAQDNGTACNVDVFTEPWLLPEKGIELRVNFIHGLFDEEPLDVFPQQVGLQVYGVADFALS